MTPKQVAGSALLGEKKTFVGNMIQIASNLPVFRTNPYKLLVQVSHW